MIDIGSNKQLFVDRRLIENTESIAFSVNRPEKIGALTLGIGVSGMVSVVAHEETYYLYGRTENREGLVVHTSRDGVLWERPPPDAFGNGRALPLPGVDSGGVFIDPRERAYPFKGLFDIRQPEPWGLDPASYGDTVPTGQTQATARGGLFLFRSADGFRWELVPGLAVPFLCDTQNQVVFDPRIDRYVAYLRAFPTLGGPHHHKRCVARVEFDDLYEMPWPHTPNSHNKAPAKHDYPYLDDEMPIVMTTDAEDPPGTDLYSPALDIYAWTQNVYVAFPPLFRHWDRIESRGRDYRGKFSNSGLFETHLAVSGDGVNFFRYRKPYVASGLVGDREGVRGDLDCGLISWGVGMIRAGDLVYQYYSGTRRVHGAPAEIMERGMKGTGVFAVKQRLDGFVSAEADHGGGELLTKPFVFQGQRLLLNVECSGLGEVWVEIQGKEGRPIVGYALDDAVSIDRNGTAQEVWWSGGPNVSQLAGRPVRLRFRMRSAKLFAFEFAEGAEGG